MDSERFGEGDGHEMDWPRSNRNRKLTITDSRTLNVDARLRSPSAQRSSRRQSDFGCAPIRSAPWYAEPNAVSHAIGYALHRSPSHHPVIPVHDAVRNVIQRPESPPD